MGKKKKITEGKRRHPLVRILLGFGKFIGVAVLSILLFVVVFLGFFFATPEFTIRPYEFRSLINKYAPEALDAKFENLYLRIIRPSGMFFAKTIALEGKDICVRYEGEAVDSCIGNLDLQVTAGWGGRRLEGESALMPRLIRIAPILITDVRSDIDLGKLPESKEETPPETQNDGPNVVEILRKHVLPKWEVEGSRLEIEHFLLKMKDGSGYFARFDLAPGTRGETVLAQLHELRTLTGELKVDATVAVRRPRSWQSGMVPAGDSPQGEPVSDPGVSEKARSTDKPLPALGPKDIAKSPNTVPPTAEDQWDVDFSVNTSLDRARKIGVKGDARIKTFQDLDFRIRTLLKGIPGVREVRLEGDLRGQRAQGLVSLRAGEIGNQVRALDFVNCAWRAHLSERTGGLRCGPQMVRLEMRERGPISRKSLFTLAPEFDLRISNAYFGDTKSADIAFELNLDHAQLVKLTTDLDAKIALNELGFKYSAKGIANLAVPQFQNVVGLLRRTPFSVPAPLNVLNGVVGSEVRLDITDGTGTIDLTAGTRLDSTYQSMHLDLTSKTTLSKNGESLIPSTNADLAISRLNLSLPRFNLAAPPAFKPDSRFGPINEEVIAEMIRPKSADDDTDPMDFRMRIHTVGGGQAIRLATNLTKSAIPVAVDVVYDAKAAAVAARAPKDPSSADQAASSDSPTDVRTLARQELEKGNKQTKSAVSGWVIVGRTPVELFRRNAVLEELRVDLLESGDNRINGRISVTYLEYAINMLLLGEANDPQIRFVSDPPLDDDQIVSVLLFGRPLEDLDEDQKSSVGSLSAAMTDAVLGISSLYLLASTPIESVGYDPESQMVTARVGLGGGAALVVGSGGSSGSGVGIRKRLTREILFRSDIETIGSTGKRTVSALVEWVKKF